MESLPVRNLISAPQNTFTFPTRNPFNPVHLMIRRAQHHRTHHFQYIVSSKKSDFQDFQGYAKPSRLLPATEVDFCTDCSLEKIIPSFEIGKVKSLYIFKLQTSSFYGSGLSDWDAGVLLCLIDENGDSVLQRVPASSLQICSTESENKFVSDEFRFQRGSVDEFSFEGPKLGRIEALWISPESGQWRVGAVNLTVISQREPPIEENDKQTIRYNSYQYDFEVDNILIGEGSGISMAELRPRLVTELSAENFSLLSQKLSQSTPLTNLGTSNEDSMKEYAGLKLSLLLYDAILVLAGSSIASFSVGENAAFAFLTGGIGGFLYLVLLQKSVDGLPVPAASTSSSRETENNVDQRLRSSLKIPVTTLALAFAGAVIASKYDGSGGLGGGGGVALFTPKDLMLGMLGFLVSKVAVVLAALKPLPVSSDETK